MKGTGGKKVKRLFLLQYTLLKHSEEARRQEDKKMEKTCIKIYTHAVNAGNIIKDLKDSGMEDIQHCGTYETDDFLSEFKALVRDDNTIAGLEKSVYHSDPEFIGFLFDTYMKATIDDRNAGGSASPSEILRRVYGKCSTSFSKAPDLIQDEEAGC